MHKPAFCAVALLLACLIGLSCFGTGAAGLIAGAIGSESAANGEMRHTVCHALSDAAKAYYSGSFSYETLAALPGAQSAGDA